MAAEVEDRFGWLAGHLYESQRVVGADRLYDLGDAQFDVRSVVQICTRSHSAEFCGCLSCTSRFTDRHRQAVARCLNSDLHARDFPHGGSVAELRL